MWRNYLSTSLRLMAKDKSSAFIDMFGLALGFASCLLLVLYVRYESSYDEWLPGADRAFQLQQWITAGDDPNTIPGGVQMTSYISGQRLREFPQIDRVVYVGNGQPVLLQNGEASLSEDFVYVDGPLFDILKVPFLRGDRGGSLAAPGSMVLTAAEALRRFGTLDVVGRVLTLVAGTRSADYRITGVIQDPPSNSHLALSVIARVDFVALHGGQVPFLTQWMAKNGWVYARLRPGADVAEIARQMPAWERRNIPDQMLAGERFNPGINTDWRLVNVRDIHLGDAQGGAMRPGNDRRTIVTFGVVAALILFMAWVNFTNLATARAGQRAREVALRKVLGASRRQLVMQFIVESLLLVTMAMGLGLATVELLLPRLNAFLNASISVSYLGPGGLVLPIAAMILLIGGAGGLYPAFYLSRFQPARILKSNRSSADGPGAGRLRNILVVFQFAVSIGLMVCTAVIYAQIVYARTADPGYKREGLLQIGNIGRKSIHPVVETLLNEIGKVEGVKALGRSTVGIATFGMENITVTAPSAADGVELNLYRVDPGFFGALGIRTLAGRTFIEGRTTDDSAIEGSPNDPTAQAALARRGYNIVLNALAARQLGFASPADAIGKTLRADDGDVEANGQTPVTIIGVVQDSRFRSVRDPAEPMMFVYDRLAPTWLLVRYEGPPARIRDTIAKVWKRIAPDVPFEAEYSDDIVRELYEAEEARALTFAVFSALAVVIGCLGLFGLAAFTTQRRTKEIGIRKVLGARTPDLVRLLVWQFSKPVLLASLIAWPAAWWVMRDWLNSFDARIELSAGPFLAAGAVALSIATGTVIGHTVKVARTSLIQALRRE